ncbi:MAG: DUF445 family protein [Treponema sp.]|nr:DUF445 family protein [Treponema sp.]
MIKNLLVSILGGAFVGWTTNSIAINMLFKKFFGRWGGVIESGYKGLIQNLSRLVEQKLVNAKTLETEIQKQNFNNTLCLWVKEILEKELPGKTKNLYVGDIPGIDETLACLSEYFEHEKSLPDALNGITFGQILSEDAYRYIVDNNAGKIISVAAEYKDIALETLNDFFSDRTFRDMFSENFINNIKENINEAARKIDFSRININQDFEEFLNLAGIDDIIKKIEEFAGETRIGELISDPHTAAKMLLNHAANFVERGDGRSLLLEAAGEFINAAETIDTKIADIAHPALIETIIIFIKRAAPKIIDRLILFIMDSRDEIDSIIDDAAEQHFNRNGRLNNPLQAFLFGAASKRASFTNKIIETLSQNRGKTGEKLAAEFTTYIKKTSIGKTVSVLKKSGLVNAEIIADTVTEKLHNLNTENIELFALIIDVKIKNLFPNLDFSFIRTKLLPHLFGTLKHFLNNESGSGGLQEKINTMIYFFMSKRIHDTVDFRKAAFKMNEADIKEFLLRSLPKLKNINAGTFLAGMITAIPWKSAANRLKFCRINGIYGVLQNETLYGKTADAVQNLIRRNLDTILGGNVFEIAKNELDVLSPPQVNSMVQDFMGTQLKPINIMGALLGGLAGALTVFAALFFRLPSAFLWTMFAAYGLVFAFTGIGTNWIAVKMLFHPYKRIAGLNFPPFIGVTALKQAEFAAGIANIIQQNMLNEASLRRFYAEKKDALYALCRERLAAEDYSFIDDFFSDEPRLAAAVDGIFDIFCDYIKNSYTKAAEHLDKFITGRIEAGGVYDFAGVLRDVLFTKIKSGEFAAYAGKQIEERIIDKDKPEYDISKIIDTLFESLYRYTRQNLKNFCAKAPYRYAAAFNAYIEGHTPANLTDVTPAIAEIAAILPQKLPSAIAWLAGGQMTDGRRLKDCFGGIFPALIKGNGRLINGMICGLAASQKPAIVSKIMDESGGESLLNRIVKRATNALMREDVEAITGIVIDEKLFPFLEAHRNAVLNILDDTLELPLGSDSKIFNKENTELVLSHLFAAAPVSHAVKKLSTSYLNALAGIKLKNLLAPLNMDTMDGFMEKSSPIVNIVVSQITLRLDDRTVETSLNKLFNQLISKIFDGRPVYSMLHGIDIEHELSRISILFFNNNGAAETTKLILGGLLQKILSDKNFYDHAIFRRDMSFFLRSCVNENGDGCSLRALKPFLAGLLRGAGGVISPPAKNAVFGDYILPSMFNSCENQFPDIVNSLSLYSVVEREIKGMHPAEIETVFYSFAGGYFKKITLYGWIGLFGGLLSYAFGCLVQFLF